ncbi:MAG: TolC family protein [Planctomycetota bacterium]
MRFCVLLFAILLALPIMADEEREDNADRLTLAKSIKLTLDNNRRILQGKEMVLGARAKVDESASYKYPQLQLDSSYTRLSLVPEAMGFKLASPDSYSYKATVSQVLFAWGKISKGIAMSQTELEMASQGVALTEREITYAVIQIFYQLLTTREAINVMDDNINLLEQRLKMMKQKYEAGEISDFDILSTEVQISSARGQRLDTVNGLDKLQMQFNLILGRPVNTAVVLDGALAYNHMEANERAAINDALANRIEIRQIQGKEKMAQLQKDLAAAANRPNLNAFGSWELKNGYQPNMDEFRGGWTFGVILSFPLFDGLKSRSQVRQANANLNSIRLEYEQQRQTIETEVRQALLDIQSAWQKIEIGKLTVTQAEKALKIADERYQKGLIDTLDILNSQSVLSNARLNLLQSAYNFNMSMYNLEKSIGKEFTIKD